MMQEENISYVRLNLTQEEYHILQQMQWLLTRQWTSMLVKL